MSDKTINELMTEHEMNKPTKCSVCGSTSIEYLGLGEYRCKDCLNRMYDNYGLVRKYIEEHPGATEVDVHMATGVGRETIRHFVREERFDVVNGKKLI